MKKATNEMKERSLLLDMYKTCTKETRDKVALMAAEKKIRCDLEEARLGIFCYLILIILFEKNADQEDVRD